MKICFFGTYVTAGGYPVNRYLIRGLSAAGRPPLVCHADLWEAPLHSTAGAWGVWTLLRLALHACVAYGRLVWRYLHMPAHDWVVVGYPGYLDVLLARVLRRGRSCRVALTAFISLYDTVVLDRGRFRRDSWRARVLWHIDRLAFRAADLVLVDTRAQGAFYAAAFALDPVRFRRSFVGHEFIDEGASAAGEATSPDVPHGDACVRAEFAAGNSAGHALQVLFFGTYVPLHGVPVIVEAAHRVRDRNIDFLLVGSGQMWPAVREQVRSLDLPRVRMHSEWMDEERLRAQVMGADVCLGIFGTTDKAARVIPYKVLGALALARPVVTRDSPAVRELLRDGESAFLCTPGDPGALARVLVRLDQDRSLGPRVAAAGNQVYLGRCAPQAVGRALVRTLEEARGES